MRTITHKVRNRRTKKVTETTLHVMGSDEYVAHHSEGTATTTPVPEVAAPTFDVSKKPEVFKKRVSDGSNGNPSDNVS